MIKHLIVKTFLDSKKKIGLSESSSFQQQMEWLEADTKRNREWRRDLRSSTLRLLIKALVKYCFKLPWREIGCIYCSSQIVSVLCALYWTEDHVSVEFYKKVAMFWDCYNVFTNTRLYLKVILSSKRITHCTFLACF